MENQFLLYGANGFVGKEVAREAVARGLRPLLAGRKEAAVKELASELGLDHRVFGLEDKQALEEALKHVPMVLHCAGPYIHTAGPMVEACIRTGTHYMDITGEIPVYESLATKDAEAKAAGVMLLPGIGFDVVPTDCLALHLKNRLPDAIKLTLAFQIDGPAGLPPGTQKTAIELLPHGERIRKNGKLLVPPSKSVTRDIDFGKGPAKALRLTWGDVFTAYHTTGIPDIEDYIAFPDSVMRQIALMRSFNALFKFAFIRKLMMKGIKPGPTPEECEATRVHVWGEVRDAEGNRAVSRLHGPEAGLTWTIRAALEGVGEVLSGNAPPGYQTPAAAFGADFVLKCEGVEREDL